ncbi:oxygenase MpaB family protein [Caulobacter sp. NIBR2454]|uniref:oxygenase MpaB family protein n=1 Tax=Caulobacter sp. NIBR2454 TaxID=3015996 RepID=UPI0022B6764B|nr:oxygenase MpaB family protein [Caulobacter sp. NIBR2454]
MPDLRLAIQAQVRQLMGPGPAAEAPDPGDDVGLFGPDAACWRVHGDFTSMMVGGVSALLLQMLHPGALAGVWDHSNFRQDMTGRLRRTAQFISGTTYGSTLKATSLIDRVRSIHDRVSGLLADGTAYSANDPDLLTWVHVAEVSSFLRAFVRHRDPTFSPADQDRYFDEVAVIAERLGAVSVPRSRAQVQAYFAAVQPQLRCDARTVEVAAALLNPPLSSPAAAAASRLVFRAAQDLLPSWAAQMHGFRAAPARGPAIRLGVQGMGTALRWALPNGTEARARRRAAEILSAPAMQL